MQIYDNLSGKYQNQLSLHKRKEIICVIPAVSLHRGDENGNLIVPLINENIVNKYEIILLTYQSYDTILQLAC